MIRSTSTRHMGGMPLPIGSNPGSRRDLGLVFVLHLYAGTTCASRYHGKSSKGTKGERNTHVSAYANQIPLFAFQVSVLIFVQVSSPACLRLGPRRPRLPTLHCIHCHPSHPTNAT